MRFPARTLIDVHAQFCERTHMRTHARAVFSTLSRRRRCMAGPSSSSAGSWTTKPTRRHRYRCPSLPLLHAKARIPHDIRHTTGAAARPFRPSAHAAHSLCDGGLSSDTAAVSRSKAKKKVSHCVCTAPAQVVVVALINMMHAARAPVESRAMLALITAQAYILGHETIHK